MASLLQITPESHNKQNLEKHKHLAQSQTKI